MYAPRILNDPVRCRFSHLSHRTADPVGQSAGVVQRGVPDDVLEQRGGGLDVGTGDETSAADME